MARRSYRQFCALARTLDLVGERWTLLVVRDLVLGPRRFTDLLEGLPGISTTLLSERLKTLEESGIVRRAAAPRPGGGVAYRLTMRGYSLAQAIAPLTHWGTSLLDAKGDDELFRPEWFATMFLGTFRPEAATGVSDCYVLRIEGRDAWMVVEDGTIRVGAGVPPRAPDLIAQSDVPTLVALGSGDLTLDEAMASGRFVVDGDVEVARRAIVTLGLDRLGAALRV